MRNAEGGCGDFSLKGELKESGKSNLTLSVDKKIIDQLKYDADIQGLSINAKVAGILSKYLYYYKHVEQRKAVTIPQKMYAALVDEIDEIRFLRKKANLGILDMIPSIFIYNNIPFTMENLIKFCFESATLWSGVYDDFQYYRDANHDLCLVFQHSFGPKWSKVLAQSFASLLEETLDLSCESQIVMNTLLIRVQEK